MLAPRGDHDEGLRGVVPHDADRWAAEDARDLFRDGVEDLRRRRTANHEHRHVPQCGFLGRGDTFPLRRLVRRAAQTPWLSTGPGACPIGLRRPTVVLAALRSSSRSATVEGVKLRSLIVDDSEPFLASARRLLESQGVEIVGTATSGAEALDLAAALSPDLALVDVELGEEDGFALADELRSRAPVTRVVLISTYGRDEMQVLVSASPAVGFLPKSRLSGDAVRALLDGDQRDAR